jgi:FKBP-type peptidyl-prolyl cis-trans isomerase (trigger factor)
MTLLLNYIFDKEKMSLSEEERQEAIAKLAPNTPKEQLNIKLIDEFLRKEKAQDFLLSKVIKKG